jgi:hypothetical protein
MEARTMMLGKLVLVLLAVVVIMWMLGGFLRNYRGR